MSNTRETNVYILQIIFIKLQTYSFTPSRSAVRICHHPPYKHIAMTIKTLSSLLCAFVLFAVTSHARDHIHITKLIEHVEKKPKVESELTLLTHKIKTKYLIQSTRSRSNTKINRKLTLVN